MFQRVRLGGAAILSLAAALVASGCAVQDLNFRVDARVTVTAPEDRARVTLPVTVTWAVRDFEITGPGGRTGRDAGYFGVFVDREPQPPGRHLDWLARDDEACLPTQGCPDEDWFSRHDVYTTADTSFTIENLRRRPDDRREFHEVIIVLLDGSGVRIGEGSWAVEFQVARDG